MYVNRGQGAPHNETLKKVTGAKAKKKILLLTFAGIVCRPAVVARWRRGDIWQLVKKEEVDRRHSSRPSYTVPVKSPHCCCCCIYVEMLIGTAVNDKVDGQEVK